MVNKKAILSLVLILSTFSACVKTQNLFSPSFSIQAKNQKTVHNAIEKALSGRGWAITTDTPGLFTAQYTRQGKYHAKIIVSYDKEKVTIKHKTSENLLYKEEATGPVIHKTYNNWIRNLENDIYRNIASLQ